MDFVIVVFLNCVMHSKAEVRLQLGRWWQYVA